jgi:hypothetical protein
VHNVNNLLYCNGRKVTHSNIRMQQYSTQTTYCCNNRKTHTVVCDTPTRMRSLAGFPSGSREHDDTS